ncbi:MAG: cadherin-like domain-containing protein [Deltaproteobacteria bacterium]|nr:cadherin-like domain-containing protein [Deltaproteobacteria bacterium]
MRRGCLWVWLLLGLVACQCDRTPGGNDRVDAGMDAGRAGSADASATGLDAGGNGGQDAAATVTDAGSDGGADASVPDAAGPVDAAIPPDGSTPDATVGNRAPVPSGDAVSTRLSAPVTVDVLANDQDPDGDALTLAAVDAAAHGATAMAAGQVTYAPVGGYFGADTFTYTVRDGLGLTAQGIVTVTILPGPQAAAVNGDGDIIGFGEDGVAAVLVSRSAAGLAARLSTPRWSPDGTRLAFGDGTHAWTAMADGANPTRMDTPIDGATDFQGGLRRLDWSPDGQWLALVGLELSTDNDALFVTRVDGTTPYTLVDLSEDGAAWLPDSSGLVYTLRSGVVRTVWQHTLGVGNVHLFGGWVQSLSGTSRLVFQERNPTTGTPYDLDLWLVTLGSADPPQRLVPANSLAVMQREDHVAWSPLGDAVAARASVPGPNDTVMETRVTLLPPDGGAATLLAQTAVADSTFPTCLAWTPEAAPRLTWVVVSQPPDGMPAVVLRQADGSTTAAPVPSLAALAPDCLHWRDRFQ